MKTRRYYISPVLGQTFKAFYVPANNPDEALGKACSRLRHTEFHIEWAELTPKQRIKLIQNITKRLEKLNSESLADVWQGIVDKP